jgi:hypothetical protein
MCLQWWVLSWLKALTCSDYRCYCWWEVDPVRQLHLWKELWLDECLGNEPTKGGITLVDDLRDLGGGMTLAEGLCDWGKKAMPLLN